MIYSVLRVFFLLFARIIVFGDILIRYKEIIDFSFFYFPFEIFDFLF